jgi:hypothetical protein
MFQVSLVQVHLLLLLHDVVVNLQIAPGAVCRNPVKRPTVATFPGRNDEQAGGGEFFLLDAVHSTKRRVPLGNRRLGNENPGSGNKRFHIYFIVTETGTIS